jgi:hypothetical protein
MALFSNGVIGGPIRVREVLFEVESRPGCQSASKIAPRSACKILMTFFKRNLRARSTPSPMRRG